MSLVLINGLCFREAQKCLTEAGQPKQPKKERRSSVLSEQFANIKRKIRRTSKSYTIEDGVVNPAFVLDSRVKTESLTNGPYKQNDVVFKEVNTHIESDKDDEVDDVTFRETDPPMKTEEAPSVEFNIRSYGPYRSSFYVVDSFDCYGDLVLIAGGSGFGFILSAITMLCK